VTTSTGAEPATNLRIVIVGASLAGLRTAEGLRASGHRGPLTIIGDEAQEPFDRPPLSKQVLLGLASADGTRLPRLTRLDGVEWLLGVPAEPRAPRTHPPEGRHRRDQRMTMRRSPA
jgi:NADPH-dependent 2,4-dienoyl-CoA reductase/sulfur reductase-like enzyme